jgi:hypothetical protein
MKLLPFMSSFVLDKMCHLIKSGIRIDKGFKEVHLIAVVKALSEHCGAEVTSTQAYDHQRKWKVRWLQVSKLKDRRA